jgi:hypothetical protein
MIFFFIFLISWLFRDLHRVLEQGMLLSMLGQRQVMLTNIYTLESKEAYRPRIESNFAVKFYVVEEVSVLFYIVLHRMTSLIVIFEISCQIVSENIRVLALLMICRSISLEGLETNTITMMFGS